MDWKAFIAAVVGALAWPVVVGILLFVLREELPNLIRRIKGATVAGTKVEFDEALDKLREETEVVAVERPLKADDTVFDERILALAESFPEAAVMEAFKSVESMLLGARQVFQFPPRSNLQTIVKKLVETKDISPEAEVLFHNLQRARNAAVHAQSGSRISPGEALDYMKQARFLQDLLSPVLD